MHGKMHTSGIHLMHLSCACLPSAQLCPTFCELQTVARQAPRGILQARILEGTAMPTSRESSWPRDQTWSPVSPAMQAQFLPEPPRLNPISCQHKVWQMWWMAASCIPLKLLCNHLGGGGSICWILDTVPFWEPSFTLRPEIADSCDIFSRK